MAKNYTVISGDTLTKIAKQHGFADWRVIYNHPSNAAFKAKRPNPDKIFPGDVIVIPDGPGTAPPAPAPAPAQSRGFFVTADVKSGQSVGEVLSSFGLDSAAQVAAVRDPRNAHLHGGAAGSVPDEAVALLLSAKFRAATTVIVPIDIRLTINRFQPVINLTDGLRPRPVGATGPPMCTHGVHVLLGRNLLAGTSLNWIQTVTKLNSSDPSAPAEFVDLGINDQPFFEHPPPGVAAPREFSDTPCGPIASRPGGGEDFTAMTTLAVLVRGHIILAAGTVWRFVIGSSNTLPEGVRATPPRDATDADFGNQLRILRAGVNQLRRPSGPQPRLRASTCTEHGCDVGPHRRREARASDRLSKDPARRTRWWHKDFPFDCPGVNAAEAAFLMFQSRDVDHQRNVLRVNGVDVFGGLPASPARDAWNGNILLIERHHQLKATGNVLRVEARTSDGGSAGGIDDFILDNVVIVYKTVLSNGVPNPPALLQTLATNIETASAAAAQGGRVIAAGVFDASGGCPARGTDNMQMRFASGLSHGSICREESLPIGPSRFIHVEQRRTVRRASSDSEATAGVNRAIVLGGILATFP